MYVCKAPRWGSIICDEEEGEEVKRTCGVSGIVWESWRGGHEWET